MVKNVAHILLLSAMVVGAHPHGDHSEDHDATHRWLSMPDGKYVCTVCGYVYDPTIVGKAFADEPDTFKCPACTQPKRGFRAWSTDDDSKPLCLNKTHHKTGNGLAMENSAVTPDPCATCGDHAKFGLRCLPSAQGGMDNFVGAAPAPSVNNDGEHKMVATADGKYVCTVCGYVYDPTIVGKAFADEPDTFKCPACTQPKKGFRAWSTADDSQPLCVNKTHHKTGNGMAMANSAVTPDPCATCGDHAKFGLRCLPSAQGGMVNFVGDAPAPSVNNDGEHKMVATADGKYVCTVCGYVYDPTIVGKAFADEPDTFKCPACTQPKKGFRAWNTADDSKPLCVNKTHHKTGNAMAMKNSAVTPDPCATCGDHAKYGLRCLPSAQGGMDNFVGDVPATSSTAAPRGPGTTVVTASGSFQNTNFLKLSSTGVLVLAWSV